jgi:hypothetical protein
LFLKLFELWLDRLLWYFTFPVSLLSNVHIEQTFLWGYFWLVVDSQTWRYHSWRFIFFIGLTAHVCFNALLFMFMFVSSVKNLAPEFVCKLFSFYLRMTFEIDIEVDGFVPWVLWSSHRVFLYDEVSLISLGNLILYF